MDDKTKGPIGKPHLRWLAAMCFFSLCVCGIQPDVTTGADREYPTGGAPVQTPRDSVRAPGQLLDGPDQANYPHLHNLLQVSERIYSGAEPTSQQAFVELSRLGVRTVVSVDGARPDLEAASRYGLRYVHIPIGYDGIPDEAGLAFARLVNDAEAPFYVHCHHGKHRGPAAAAIISIADRSADGPSARAVLERAGTSELYAGLWRDVAAYSPPEPGVELPELVAVAEVESLAVAMAGIDRAYDNLDRSAAAGWSHTGDHPDIAPRQEALLMKEGFRESVRRLESDNPLDDRFLSWMREAEQVAARLEAGIADGDPREIDSAFANVQDQCLRCHREYRD